jgi:soluble lytic murein transglycosylase-like protein
LVKIRQLIPAVLLLSLLSVSSQASATMYGFLDAKGVFHYRDVPEKSGRIKIILRDRGSRAQLATHESDYTTDQFDPFIREAATKSQIDPLLVRAVIKVESNFNPKAVSRKGARGLMQIMPDTARQLSLNDPFSPKKNITAGTKYLKQQLDSFDDIRLGLAAYNAGAGRVTSQGMIASIPETQAYVDKVMGYYRQYKDDQ